MRKKRKENLDFFESDLFKGALKEYDIKRMNEVESQLEKVEDVPIYTKTYVRITKLFKQENMNTIDKIYFYSNRLAVGLVISGVLITVSLMLAV